MRYFLGFFLFVSVLTHGTVEKHAPILFFHGGGGGAPQSLTDLSLLRKRFEKQGFEKEQLYQVHYPSSKNLREINEALKPQILEILSRYPAGQKVDLVGHSLGHVVSLLSFSNLNLLQRIGKLVGLAGVMFGQYGDKPGLCRFKLFSPYFCGDLFDWLLGTLEPVIVMNILDQHPQEIESIQKCSIFSADDGVLDPYDSGAFPDGVNIEIPHIHHYQFKNSKKVFQTLIEGCFKNTAD